jgi:hypothetical protein
VSGYLIGSQQSGRIPLPPKAELQWWYQFYFTTERGRDGYDKYRHDFSKLIWQLASPKWDFDDATFDRSAEAFDNPDHVAVVIHNYRWRLGLAEGESKYDDLENRLAQFPVIAVPTITLEGDANGAPHAEPSSRAASDTICRRKRRPHSPKPSSTSARAEQRINKVSRRNLAIRTVARLQQYRQFEQLPLIGPCLHTIGIRI